MMRKLFLLSFLLSVFISFGQTTFVPDDGLENRLQQLGLDSGPLDDLVLTANINTLEDFSPGNFTITDITGLQDFIALTDLTLNDEIADLSPIEGLVNLEDLSISDATATSLNLSELVNLTFISLRRLSNITSVNLSSNVNLTEVVLEDSGFTSVILSNNPLVESLDILDTQISTLDLSSCTALRSFNIVRNSLLQNIDFTQNTAIEFFTVDENDVLTSLDFSNSPSITSVDINDNPMLTFIDIKNGNNTAIGQTFKVKDNDALNCVQVDDAAWSWINWRFPTDYFAGFSEDCSVTNNITEVPDANFEQRLITLGYDAGPTNGMVHTPNIVAVTSLSVNNAGIADLTGVEDFTALGTLRVFDNSLTSLDVSQNLELKDLRCFNNQLSVLDVSANTKLEDLRCFDNTIESLDLSNNGLLESVKVYNNNLSSLNVKNGNNSNISTFETTGNSNLTCIDVDDVAYANSNWTDIDSQTSFSLNCDGGGGGATVSIPDIYFEEYLESIGAGNGIDYDGLADLAACQALTSVVLNNIGTVEDLTGIQEFTSMTYLNVSGNSIQSVDLSSNTNLVTLDISSNLLTALDVSSNINLTSLSVSNNSLTSLDVSDLSALEILRCNSNQLTELNVVENTDLLELNVSSNSLVDLNLLSNTNLEQLYAESNSLEYLDLSQNASLTTVTVILNSLIGLNLKNGNNTALSNGNFAAFDNPNLTCIQVDDVNYSNSNWGQIDMASSFSENCTPVNDNCSFPIPIVLGQDTPGDTTSASAGVDNPNCAQSGIVLFDVWYQVDAPASGSIVLNLSAQPLIAKIAIYDSCSDDQPFACDEDTLSADNLNPGQTYYLRVWLEASTGARTSSSGQTGSFTMNVEDAEVLSVSDESNKEVKLGLYPNPTSDIVNIQLSTNERIENIEVYSLMGKRVLQKQDPTNQFDLSSLSSGVYIIQVETNRGRYSRKLLKK